MSDHDNLTIGRASAGFGTLPKLQCIVSMVKVIQHSPWNFVPPMDGTTVQLSDIWHPLLRLHPAQVQGDAGMQLPAPYQDAFADASVTRSLGHLP